MIRPPRSGGWPVCWSVALLAAVACAFPTERSDQVNVEVMGLPGVLMVGDSLRVDAVVTSDGRPVANGLVVLSSSSAAVLAVEPGHVVHALAVGNARITATAAGFSGPGTSWDVRVRGPAEIDSVRPGTVHFGDTLSVYGFASDLDSTSVLVGGMRAPVKHIEPQDTIGRAGRIVVWVPVGAPGTAPVSLRVATQSSDATHAVTVLQEDPYEPNDQGSPSDLGTLPQGFFDPMLALEAGAGGTTSDWYAFANAARQDRTITLSGEVQLTLRSGAGADRPALSIEGTFGSYFSLCRGASLQFPLSGDTARVALVGMPVGAFKVEILDTMPPQVNRTKPYALGIENGVVTTLPPDSLEGNDYCDDAPEVAIDVGERSLNIHGPLDLDWFRVTVPPSVSQILINVSFPGPDTLDMVLYQVDPSDTTRVYQYTCTTGCPIYPPFSITNGPTFQQIIAPVSPGTYFLVVNSYYGVPMPYTLLVRSVQPAPLEAYRSLPLDSSRPETGRRHWIMGPADTGRAHR